MQSCSHETSQDLPETYLGQGALECYVVATWPEGCSWRWQVGSNAVFAAVHLLEFGFKKLYVWRDGYTMLLGYHPYTYMHIFIYTSRLFLIFCCYLPLLSYCESFSITNSDWIVWIHHGAPEAANWSTEREYSWDGAGYSSIYAPETWTRNSRIRWMLRFLGGPWNAGED